METRFCLICDKEFHPRAYEDEFCSPECAADWDEYWDGEDDEDEDMEEEDA